METILCIESKEYEGVFTNEITKFLNNELLTGLENTEVPEHFLEGNTEDGKHYTLNLSGMYVGYIKVVDEKIENINLCSSVTEGLFNIYNDGVIDRLKSLYIGRKIDVKNK
jgi:hypothetical protein